jgi:hypothetical protein
MTPLSQNSLEDARQQLANCVLFRGLVTGERDAVVGRARMRHFAAGETIFLMGSPGGSMMAVLSGTVRISIPSQEAAISSGSAAKKALFRQRLERTGTETPIRKKLADINDTDESGIEDWGRQGGIIKEE